MKSQHQNFQDQLYRNYNTQEFTLTSQGLGTVTVESFNLDSRICYKKRREELNRRVKSIIEQKQQIASQKIREKN